MTEQPLPADHTARSEALDPARSFIVQAPAGSGKTDLLIKRYLRLLADADRPEAILAITFTKKAAAEMRNRVLDALRLAAAAAPTSSPHEQQLRELAEAAHAQAVRHNWQLEQHPARLRIQTIDSFNAELTRQLPLLAEFGAQPQITEAPALLYEEASRLTLTELESKDTWSTAIADLLRHLDNDWQKAQGLITAMLPRREQWLWRLGEKPERARLEQALANEIRYQLGRLRSEFTSVLTPAECNEVCALAAFAADNLDPVSAAALLACRDLQALPGTEPADLPVWQGLAGLLLTKTGSRRKKVDKRDGFPADCKAEKARLLALVGQLEQTPALLARLDFCRVLPPANYSEQQWRLLAALIQVLPLAVAQLRLVFAQTGQVDFPELAHAAQRALGQVDAPTDLALRLDYRLQHILIDEFQDTSNSQWSLLQLLTAGWQPGDGRTLFLVGDPMQSIYRFREAEVGLYLHAWSHGLGDIRLVPLSLTVNFRSTAAIVDWVNDCFAAVMPQQSDATSAAVAYAPSIAWRSAGTTASVTVHPQYTLDFQQEADIVSNILADCGNRHCAILVQNRNHLLAIVPRLRTQGIAFRAVEIERLGQQPVVLDLLALTRALLHPADRIAWLSVLHAPWCGLTRSDLHALVRYEALNTQAIATLPTVLQQLADQGFVADGLSVTGSKILQRIWPCLQQALLEQRRGLLRDSVERLWLQLGGASAVDSVTALTDAQAYFELLEHTEVGADLESAAQLERELERLFAAPDTQTTDDDLQILTIHKAKGLEFDNVILPGLGRPGRHDDPKLLLWQERQRDQGSELLLAPLTATGAERDQVYAFVNRLEQERSAYERGRLLYVAATRAREQLHLLGHVNVKTNADGEIETAKPKAGSALALLWPQLEAVYQQSLPSTLPDTTEAEPVNTWQPQRLPADWTLPALPDTGMMAAISAMASAPVTATADYSPEYWWAGETARAVGIVVHRLLMRIAAEGVDAWPDARLTAGTALIKYLLQQQGLVGAVCETAAGQVLAALQSTLADDRGRWLLAAEHREAANEYALNRLHDGRLETVILDRTFVDKDDVRWIVDYKTGSHAGTDINTFLDREQERYRPQLERYAEFMRVLDQRPIRLGLYFPLLKCWREWAAS